MVGPSPLAGSLVGPHPFKEEEEGEGRTIEALTLPRRVHGLPSPRNAAGIQNREMWWPDCIPGCFVPR